MTDYSKDPLSGITGAIWKFVLSAMCGAMISLVVFVVVFALADENSFWYEEGVHVYWIIPLVWGVLGIFWFERMLTVARDVVEWVCGIGDR